MTQPGWGVTSCSRAAIRHPHHYVLGVRIVGEGAVIKHDLVEHLGGDLRDLGAVVAQVPVFGNHRLAQRDGGLARSLLLANTGREAEGETAALELAQASSTGASWEIHSK